MNGTAGTIGAGGTNGAGGSGSANNNPACPGTAQMDGDMCTEPADAGRNGLTCNYTAGASRTSCDCQRGNLQRDGGRAPSTWNCNTVTLRDAGGGAGGAFNFDAGGIGAADAGACPATMDGDMCTTRGQYCRNGAGICRCFGGQWNCP